MIHDPDKPDWLASFTREMHKGYHLRLLEIGLEEDKDGLVPDECKGRTCAFWLWVKALRGQYPNDNDEWVTDKWERVLAETSIDAFVTIPKETDDRWEVVIHNKKSGERRREIKLPGFGSQRDAKLVSLALVLYGRQLRQDDDVQ